MTDNSRKYRFSWKLLGDIMAGRPSLGLFLSQEILAITGLTIRETGEPGKGVRFVIAIPRDAYRFSPDR